MTHPSLLILFPQILLAASGCLLLLVFQRRTIGRTWIGGIGLLLVVAAGIGKGLVASHVEDGALAEIAVDPHAEPLQWLLLGIGGVFAALVSQRSCSERSAVECMAMLLFATAGAMLAAIADDLVLFTVAWSLVVLPVGFMVSLSERRSTADEAALKFAIASGISCGMILTGFVLLYALSGTTTLSAMNFAETSSASTLGLGRVAVVFIVTGCAVALAAVPLHFATADVVDGVDGWTAGVVLLVPRLAAAAVLWRFCRLPPTVAPHTWIAVALILAVTTFFGAGVSALLQSRLQRLFAYAVMAQSGFWLLGLAVMQWWGAQENALETQRVQAVWMGQLWASSIAIVGLSATLIDFDSGRGKGQFLVELTGLAHTRPATAAVVAVCLFSLAGFPPLIGFWSQSAVCWTALSVHLPSLTHVVVVHRGFVIAACAGVVGNVLMAAVAIRVCGVMFFHTPLSKTAPNPAWGAKVVALAAAAAIFAGGLVPDLVWPWLTN